MEVLLAIVFVALSLRCIFQSCASAGCSSAYGIVGLNNDGAFQFPVFHIKHPYVGSLIHLANLPTGASPVIGNDEIHEDKFFMAISLGTPPVGNLVTIDTGSTLSWVVCQPSEFVRRYRGPEAGASFNPHNSTTYQRIGCSSRDCADVQSSLVAPFGCIEETDTCLYSLRYGSGDQYSAGKLVKDKLSFATGSSTVDDFVFGCSKDEHFNGRESGIIGLGNESFSFFNQVVRQTNYNAFSYCFPGDKEAEGFLSIGPYPKDNLVYTNLIGPRFEGDRRVYSLQQMDMMVDGRRLQINPYVYVTAGMMIVDSGTADTFLAAPVFDAFAKAMTAAMRAKGYAASTRTCFKPTAGDSVEWGDLPTVEMKFLAITLKLPVDNVFHGLSSDGKICLAFQPDVAGVRGVQILGNKATRSFRVVHDLQAGFFGFEAGAC